MTDRFEIECLNCGARSTFDLLSVQCDQCGGTWRTARYDLPSAARAFKAELSGRDFDLWRYEELLPMRTGKPDLAMGEGGTPLLHAYNLGTMLGLPHLYIKDERQGPTASFKDRQAAVTVMSLKEAGVTEAVIASTGNVAIAFSAYCARAGIKLWAFLTSLVPPEKMYEVALYGTQVVKLSSDYDEAREIAAEFAQERDLYFDAGGKSIPSVESMKTIALEIGEQLPALKDLPEAGQQQPGAWRAPDWYIQAVSGGLGPLGVLKGFEELRAMGMISRVPALGCIQTDGCAPMAKAWRRGDWKVTPVASPDTYISTLSTGDPGYAYTLLREGMLSGGGGIMESVSDEQAYRAMHLLAKMEGLSIEPAAAVAFAGLFKLAQMGLIERDQIVVVNCSGHTLPIDKELLAEDRKGGIILAAREHADRPKEGLMAALQLDQRRVRQVLIVDDHADARRLMRRILQAQGEFLVEEAASGAEALGMAERNPPDLVILDLMMPEMDGFAVLDKLKARPETLNIPVIVITAKELLPTEKEQLRGRISRLMTKGEFFDDDLLDEIEKVLS